YLPQNLSKNPKKGVDKVYGGVVIYQSCLAGRTRGTAAEAFRYSLYAFFEENFFKKLSENLLTIKRF
ncbi:hypothetical protein NE586_14615, partial [Gemmiger formicilis]|uniref:hypothetical protein n=1 Tax=Gemmiger formicilis TaxID=745368 RepID=UPI00210A730D